MSDLVGQIRQNLAKNPNQAGIAKPYNVDQLQPKPDNPNSLPVNIGGVLGNTLGTGLGALVPGGGETGATEYGGGILGGSAVGGLVDYLQQLLSGKSPDMGKVGQAASTQGAYSAIPGSEQMRGAKGISKLVEPVANPVLNFIKQNGANAAIRGAAGFAGGAGAQGINNLETSQPIGQNVLSTGAKTAVGNATIPAIGDVAGAASKKVSNIAGDLVNNSVASARQKLATQHFGLMGASDPEIAAMANKDPLVSAQNIKQANVSTKDQLNNLLDQFTGSVKDFKKSLVDAADIVPPGARGSLTDPAKYLQQHSDWLDRQLSAYNAAHPPAPMDLGKPSQDYGGYFKRGSEQPAYTVGGHIQDAGTQIPADQLPLSAFNSIKSTLGTHYDTDPASNNMWGAAKNFIMNQLKNQGDNQTAQDAQDLFTKQQNLIGAQKNISKLVNGNKIPATIEGDLSSLGSLGSALSTASFFTGHPAIGMAIKGGQYMVNNPSKTKQLGDIANNIGKTGGSILQNILNQTGIRSGAVQ